MVRPALQEHITIELHKEATLLKEKRKLKEERNASRAGPSGIKGGDSASKGLQSKLDAQANQIKKLEEKVAAAKGGKVL